MTFMTFFGLTCRELLNIRERAEQERILRANHIDATAGHMGVKKTLNRINERFMWHGLVKDVEDMVNIVLYNI